MRVADRTADILADGLTSQCQHGDAANHFHALHTIFRPTASFLPDIARSLPLVRYEANQKTWVK